MSKIDDTIKILKELLYGDRENLSPYGIDEQIGYAITNLKVYKERNTNNGDM